MKRTITAILAFAASALAVGATLTPVQLLNPSGSTAGQAIISTGPSTAPGWATVSVSTLAPISANSVLGNFSGSAASPSASAVPSCSTANSALQYTSGVAFTCGTTFALTSGTLAQFASTTSAQLAGVLSDETGTGSAVFSASPALTGTPTAPTAAANTNTTQLATTAFVEGEFAAPPAAGFGSTTRRPVAATTISATSTITPSSTAGIVGTTTNDSANAGSVGEYQTATTTNTSMSNGVGANLTSVSLTAGDWDVQCSAYYHPAGSTTITGLAASVSTVSANLGAFGATTYLQLTFNTGSGNYIMSPVWRLSLASTTTVYCVGVAAFGTSTMQGDGFIRARRVR
ncbi:hypothetical protein [Ralstonia mannitolilytica]|uniref:hypothetical protein n=1 Tax=Ralstonia mannitolilytica TaxID=105219 RepID=UPI0007B00726|nr:hypothetical protein [Ralstonia mannitolilytica]ANA34298.1 hypothetical protein VZ52_13315 [Ralstonia mannitolilytica]